MDRNVSFSPCRYVRRVSLSARRAWIEISVRSHPGKPKIVALRKESVDRNRLPKKIGRLLVVALRKESVDRNIESANLTVSTTVALRKESVDRNMSSLFVLSGCFCRSPQGERG